MQTGDTIAAISSAVGPAARIIVRMSGPQSTEIASHFTALTGKTVSLHRLRFSGFAAVPAWLYHFCAPHSATGEDTLEFHLPGNPLLARMMLEELLRHGARSAEPGEFTARAYFNGKIDLSQAEGVAATIAAASDAELRSARQLSAGELSRRVQPSMDAIADTLALVEVGIDFSEEDVQFLSREQILSRIESASESLSSLLRDSARLERLSHVPQFVLVGHPNAGKSTLLNALAGEERAVVSPIAGTTRDALSMEIALLRGIVRLIDVAGIDQAIGSNNPIESQMRQRAFSVVETSDHVILVRDCTNDRPDPPIGRAVDLTVKTKVDLSPESRGGLRVSARTGIGMQQLREKLDELAFGTETAPALAINARHLQMIETAIETLGRAKRQAADGAAELIAVELRDALDALGAILGQVTPDDVLGRIFSTFCIGK